MIRKLNITLLLLLVFIGNILFAQTKTPPKATTKPATATKPAAGKQAGKIVFTKDPATGVEYHFYKHDKKGKIPTMEDFVSVIMVYSTEGDSMLFDSRKKGGDSVGAIKLNLKKAFNGCLEQGIAMMATGDSAAFKIRTDSLFLKSFHFRAVPPVMQKYTYLVFRIKLIKSETQKEMMDEMAKAVQDKRNKEMSTINKYLKDSNLHPTITPDSLYIIKHTTTTGTAIAEGDSVYVTYSGTLLNGQVFDASSKHGPQEGMPLVNGQPALPAVYSKGMHLIQGWVIMLGMMHEGESATILVPSALGYGERGAGGQIGPFTPLLFNLTVLKVKANK